MTISLAIIISRTTFLPRVRKRSHLYKTLSQRRKLRLIWRQSKMRLSKVREAQMPVKPLSRMKWSKAWDLCMASSKYRVARTNLRVLIPFCQWIKSCRSKSKVQPHEHPSSALQTSRDSTTLRNISRLRLLRMLAHHEQSPTQGLKSWRTSPVPKKDNSLNFWTTTIQPRTQKPGRQPMTWKIIKLTWPCQVVVLRCILKNWPHRMQTR
jgi:hypothetical protein